MSPQTLEYINAWAAIFGITLAPVSIILGILACIQAAYYFTKSKETEAELKKQLAVMATQNEFIQEITKNMLSKTISTISKIAQNPSTKGPADNADFGKVLSALDEIKTSNEALKSQSNNSSTNTQNSIGNHKLPNLADPMTKELLQFEAISAVGQIFIYSGLTNIYAQYLLPPRSELATQRAENLSLQHNIQVVEHSLQTCKQAYEWLKQAKSNIPEQMNKNAILPTLIQYESIFMTQLRPSEAAFDYWETIKSQRN